jgi:ATP-dependent helicase HrpB
MLKRISREKRRLVRLALQVKKVGVGDIPLSAGELLAIAYPDRIGAQRKPGSNRYLLSNGRAARLPDRAPLSSPFIVVPILAGGGAEGVIELAVTISLDEVERIAGERIRRVVAVEWNEDVGGVEIREDRMLDSLTLSSSPIQNPEDGVIVHATIEGIRRSGMNTLPWSRGARALRARIAFLNQHSADLMQGIPGQWPDVSDQGLLDCLETWLEPQLIRGKGRNRISDVNMLEALLSLLGWQERAELDRLAPERIRVPSGAQIRIDYSRPEEPILPVRLQDMFGGTVTPRIASGLVPLTLHLLSPAYRPVQITRDLKGFWKGSYAEVRKEMKGRYPKHRWPENPQDKREG